MNGFTRNGWPHLNRSFRRDYAKDGVIVALLCLEELVCRDRLGEGIFGNSRKGCLSVAGGGGRRGASLRLCIIRNGGYVRDHPDEALQVC